MSAGGDNKLLTSREAAEYLGLTYRVFMRHYREWGIPYRRPKESGPCWFRVRSLNWWLEQGEHVG